MTRRSWLWTTSRWRRRPGIWAALYEALQDERVPFGWAVQHNSHWSYNISPGALVRYKREGLPMYRLKDVSEIICEDVNRLIDQRMSLVGKLTSVLLET